MSKQYIKSSNEAPSLGLSTYLLWFLALKYFKAPQWLYGVAGAIAVILIITFFVRLFTEEGVDVVDRS